MPSIETSKLPHKAILWYATNDGDAADYDDYGNRKLDAKKEINTRWTIKKRESVDAEGQVIVHDEMAVVDQEILVGSIIWKGALCDLPTTITNLREVTDYEEIADIKGRRVRRKISMMRYSDELPTLS